MTFSDERDRQLGIQILQQGLLGREQLAAAFSDPQRCAETDLCAVLQLKQLLTEMQANSIRKSLGIPASPRSNENPSYSPIAPSPNTMPGSSGSHGSRPSAPSGGPRPSTRAVSSSPPDSREQSLEESHGSSLKKQSEDLFKQIFQSDPYFSPHAETVLKKLDKLGEGGMGVVYRAQDQKLNRQAALKVIQPSRAGRKAVQRFLRESKITAGLDHPSIPPVYEAGTNSEGEHYLLMRMIHGQTLEDRIAHYQESQDPRELQSLIEVLIKVGEAMAYAHSRRIIHRDLKPANIMVGEFGEVMVMDWGLAVNLGQKEESTLDSNDDSDIAPINPKALTRVGASLGTVGYMSPEQATGDAADGRTDIFSLGAILTVMLTGRSPVHGDSAAAALVATMDNRIASPRDIVSGLPPELCSISEKALAFRPEDRYSFANEMVDDLKSFLVGAEVYAHSYSVLERTGRWIRRHPRSIVTVMILSLSATLAGGLWAELRRSQAATELSNSLLVQAKKDKAVALASSSEKKKALVIAQEKIRLEQRVSALAKQSKVSAEKAKIAAENSARRLRMTLDSIAEARVLALRGAKKSAIREKIDRALKEGGESLPLFMTAAQIYESAKHYDEAQLLLERAVIMFPPAYDALFFLHRLETRDDAVGRFRFTDSLRKLWREAKKRGDENEFTLFSKAFEAQQKGQVAEALKFYSQVEKYSTTFTWLYINRGVIKFQSNDKAGALKDFNRALELDPSMVKVYSNRGYIRYELEDFTGAVSDFNRALEMDPSMALAYGNRALAKAKLGQKDAALVDADRAVELGPNSAQTHGARGTVLRILGRNNDALLSYNNAIRLNSNFAKAYRRRALTRFELGDKKGALTDFEAFLKLNPNHSKASVIRLKVKELRRALKTP
ncbi:MAG: protein kinase [Planctomycetota bacterium]|nr:protein kinase [Planctomycetota bacterium]